MTAAGSALDVSRRRLLAAAGVAAVAGPLPAAGAAAPDPAGATPPVAGLHQQFGAEAAAEVVVSWHSLQPVRRPRVLLGRPDGRLERVVEAATVSYVDGKSGQTVHAHHARIGGLSPDSDYLYAALHEAAAPQFGRFRTAPRGRAGFTFTSFGDQGTPSIAREFVPPAGVTLPNPVWMNDNLGSAAAGDTTLGVERIAPLFHLFNGDPATPTWPRTGSAPGATSGPTTAAAPATVPGCPRPATTRTSSATGRSATRPTRPISRSRRPPARPS
jgi:hypothetical protein